MSEAPSKTQAPARIAVDAELRLTALPGIPIVAPGDDLPSLIAAGLERAGLTLRDGDVLVVTSKVVSRAEGRFVDLQEVAASARAVEVGAAIGKDARIVELILRESTHVSRMAPNHPA